MCGDQCGELVCGFNGSKKRGRLYSVIADGMSNVGGCKCGKRDPQDTGNFVNFHTDHFWLVAHSSLVSLAAVIRVVTKRSSSLAFCGEEHCVTTLIGLLFPSVAEYSVRDQPGKRTSALVARGVVRGVAWDSVPGF